MPEQPLHQPRSAGPRQLLQHPWHRRHLHCSMDLTIPSSGSEVGLIMIRSDIGLGG